MNTNWTFTSRFSLLAIILFSYLSAGAQLSLPWTEDFENAAAGAYTTNQTPIPGLTGTGYSWDFEALGPLSRIRTNAGIAYNSGSRAITMDNSTTGAVSTNYLILTADLSGYTGSDDLELSFHYMQHGDEPHPQDSVWIRGNSSAAWIPVYQLIQGFGVPAAGVWNNITGIDIDATLIAAGQLPSSTFQVRFGQGDDFSATGPTGTDGITIDDVTLLGTLPVPNNAGVIAMNSPTNPIPAGLVPVEIRVKNFGIDTLYSFEVEWTFQGVPQASVIYPGLPLNPGDEVDMNMGNLNLSTGENFDFRFWTTNPNGTLDNDNSNDTLDASVCRGLSGVYSLGTPTSDYPTFDDALFALASCGVSGAVLFNVAPGTYTQQIPLFPVFNASSTNTITFDGGDTTTTTITHDASGANGNATILYDGADYIHFRNLRIETTGTNDAWGVQFINGANENRIQNCRIDVPYFAGIFDVIGIVFSSDYSNDFGEGQNGNSNLITGNIITGGEMGIHAEGQFGAMNTGNRFMYNIITGVDDYGIYIDEQANVDIIGNHVSGIASTLGDGIYCFDIIDFGVTNNIVNAPDYGIYISDGNFSGDGPSSRGRIINNMSYSSTDAAFYFLDVQMTDIYHNSCSGARGMYTSNAATLNIRNNIFHGSTGYAFESQAAVNMDAMDYNLFYTPPANPQFLKYGTPTYTDLIDWQTNGPAGYDANSLEADPTFMSTTDLHIQGLAPNDVGDGSTQIFSDVDNEPRPQGSAVDIGADEYLPILEDAVMVALYQPTDGGCGDSNQVVEVIISNLGANPLSNVGVTAEITGSITTTLNANYAGPLAYGQNDTLTLGTINTNAGGYFTFTIYTNLSGDQNTSNDTLVLTVGVAPDGPVTPVNDTVCFGIPANLTVLPTPGLSLNWYSAPTGGASIYTGDTFTTAPLSGNVIYYVEPSAMVADSIETLFAGGNGQSGAMFDVTALNNITISGFSGHAFTPGVFTYEIYYKVGTATGFMGTPAAWTQIAGPIAINSGPTGTPHYIPIPVANQVNIPAGQTYAFYVTTTASTIAYTNGTGVGNLYVQDPNIQVFEGYGVAYPFGGTFAPRVWNGRIHYFAGGTACDSTRVAVEGIAVSPQTINLGVDTMICSNVPLVLDAQISGEYVWSTNEVSQQITADAAGTYFVRVLDDYQCISLDTIVVDVHPEPNISAAVNDPNCNGVGDGGIDQTVTGTGPFTFVWSNSETTEDVIGLSDGPYFVTITDASSSCPYFESYTLTQPDSLDLGTVVTNASCPGVANGAIDLTLTGGVGSYSFAWSNASTTEDLSGLLGGTYTVTVTDANSCTTTNSIDVIIPNALTITLDSIQDENVDIGGGIYISLTGGSAPYTVAWSNGQDDEDLTDIVSATYVVVVTDANGCVVTDTFTVNYTIPIGIAVEEVEGLNDMQIFPNPTRDIVWVKLDLEGNVPVRLDLFDVAGRHLQSFAENDDSQQTYELDLSNYAGGVYMVRMVIDNQVLTHKIVLQR